MTAAQESKTNLQVQRLLLAKIAYAVDAAALSLAVFLVLLILPALYPYIPNLPPSVPLIAVGLSIAFTIFALIANFFRCRKVNKLEKLLEE